MADSNLDLVAQLTNNFETLKDRYDGLKQEVKMLKSEKEHLLKQLEEAMSSHAQLEEKMRIWKMAQTFSGNGGEMADTKKKINQMVREIDKCIALLNR